MGSTTNERQRETAARIRKRQLLRMGLHASEEELLIHDRLLTRQRGDSADLLEAADRWFKKLLVADASMGICPQDACNRGVGERCVGCGCVLAPRIRVCKPFCSVGEVVLDVMRMRR